MKNDLIILEQLPKIKYQLEQLSIEIKEKVDRVNNLIVNEDTIKETKKLRAELNKEFNDLEMQRKTVKQAIMSKYDEFEEIYKENVSILYKNADNQLKEKIDVIEDEQKKKKEEILRDFFKQYQENLHLENIIKFEDAKLNITISASEKFLKDEIVCFCTKISEDIKAISLEENKEEILLEYKNNGFDYTRAKLTLLERKKQLEQLKQQQEQKEEIIKQEEQVVEKVEEIITPKEMLEDEDILEVTFTIKSTKEKIIKLKDYMKELGIDYE